MYEDVECKDIGCNFISSSYNIKIRSYFMYNMLDVLVIISLSYNIKVHSHFMNDSNASDDDFVHDDKYQKEFSEETRLKNNEG
jgi:hypothetical protein